MLQGIELGQNENEVADNLNVTFKLWEALAAHRRLGGPDAAALLRRSGQLPSRVLSRIWRLSKTLDQSHPPSARESL